MDNFPKMNEKMPPCLKLIKAFSSTKNFLKFKINADLMKPFNESFDIGFCLLCKQKPQWQTLQQAKQQSRKKQISLSKQFYNPTTHHNTTFARAHTTQICIYKNNQESYDWEKEWRM